MPARVAIGGTARGIARRRGLQAFFRRRSDDVICARRISVARESRRKSGGRRFRTPAVDSFVGNHQGRSHLVARRIHAGRGDLESVRAARQARRLRRGVYLNQPSPHAKGSGPWGTFFADVAAAGRRWRFSSPPSAATSVVFQHTYSFSTLDQKGDPSFVTPIFNLEGRTAGVELTVHTEPRQQLGVLRFRADQ